MYHILKIIEKLNTFGDLIDLILVVYSLVMDLVWLTYDEYDGEETNYHMLYKWLLCFSNLAHAS